MRRTPRPWSLVLAGIGLLGTSCPSLRASSSSTLHRGAAEALAVLAGQAVLRIQTPSVPVVRLEDEQPGSWPSPSPEQLAELDAPAPVAQAKQSVDPERALGALAKETFVFQRPSFGSKKLGYLRAGAVVARGAEPVGHAHCKAGWYGIEPEGYVCVGKAATIDLSHERMQATAFRPDRRRALPYEYGRSRFPTPPLYTRVPTPEQQAQVEADLAGHLAQRLETGWQDVEPGVIPNFLKDGAPAFMWNGHRHSPAGIYTGRALVQSGFALTTTFESDGRRFGLTVDFDIVPLDRLRRVEASSFKGVVLGDGAFELPLAFVRTRGAWLYAGDPKTTGLKPDRLLAYREAVALSGQRARVGGISYLETRQGQWLRDERLVKLDQFKKRPGWAAPGRTWLDISILKQSLVAYEGDRPVYATLVSTGADGLGDPKETHSTVRGQFLIHTKHVTSTMSGDEVGDEFELRDVPYVQYFSEGYALHAAYWHDVFGQPKSHGCINLSPEDARFLFGWTDPPVPANWHGAMSLRQGTLVHVHP